MALKRLFLLAALSFALLLLPQIAQSKSKGKYKSAEIIRIVDGDTFIVRLDGKIEKIRLYGIDTPELHFSKKMRKNAKECKVRLGRVERLGLFAKKHASKLLSEWGENISIVSHGKGYYHRILATVYTGKTDFNAKMIEDGYACVYRKAKGNKLYLKKMKKAKKENKGLWRIDRKLMECLCGY